MNRFDFYSGEPVQPGSPPFGGCNMSNQMVYNGGSQVGTSINIGGAGYDPGPMFMNPPQPNLQPQGFRGGYVGNPAFQMIQNNPNLMGGGGLGMNPFARPVQPTYQDQVVHVPGLNQGHAIFSSDLEDQMYKLQFEMMEEQEKAAIEREKRFQGYFNNNFSGYNYYGMPYYANTMDRSIEMKYRQKAQEIAEQAIQRSMTMNKNLSMLARGYLGEEVTPETEQQLDKVYSGYTYTIPAAKVEEDYEYARLKGFKEVSNQPMYAQHHREVQNAMHNVVGKSKDLNEFLEAQGTLTTINMLEDEMHKRRNATRYYQEDSYRRFLRKSIMERDGINNTQLNQQGLPLAPGENIPMGSNVPTLNNAATLLDDGTISITAPNFFGSPNINRNIVIDNEMERHFEENRMRFLQSIYAQEANGA